MHHPCAWGSPRAPLGPHGPPRSCHRPLPATVEQVGSTQPARRPSGRANTRHISKQQQKRGGSDPGHVRTPPEPLPSLPPSEARPPALRDAPHPLAPTPAGLATCPRPPSGAAPYLRPFPPHPAAAGGERGAGALSCGGLLRAGGGPAAARGRRAPFSPLSHTNTHTPARTERGAHTGNNTGSADPRQPMAAGAGQAARASGNGARRRVPAGRRGEKGRGERRVRARSRPFTRVRARRWAGAGGARRSRLTLKGPAALGLSALPSLVST